MDEKFRKSLEDNGTDVETVLKRFLGNEAMYMKFIMKFMDDKSYEGVIESIEKKDYEEAFKSAHSLKGVTANLGIEPIRAASSRITDLLRNKPAEEVDVSELEECKSSCRRHTEISRKLLRKTDSRAVCFGEK